jgi:thymidylate synthase (FAD)
VNYSKINVEYVDHMGTDLSVVNAARVSFDKESALVDGILSSTDEKLISYLATHGHWSPFAHTSIQLRVKAPIFIARQLVKHQVGGVWNEVSRRYVSSEVELFAPYSWRGKPANAKQGSTGLVDDQSKYNGIMDKVYELAIDSYNTMIEEGVAPEQARMVLPLGSMTEWYWTGSLMFWARVCKQRLDGHAQEEAQIVAKLISEQCSKLYPISWAVLMK